MKPLTIDNDHSLRNFLKRLYHRNIYKGNSILFREPKPVITETVSFKDVTTEFVIDNITDSNVSRYMRIVKPSIRETTQAFKGNRVVKFKIIFTSEFHSPITDETIKAYYNAPFETIFSMNNFDRYYALLKENFLQWIDAFQENGSGYEFRRVIKTHLKLTKTDTLAASSYLNISSLLDAAS